MEYNDYYDDSIKPFFGVVEEVLTESFVRVRVFGIHPLDKNKVRTDQLPPMLVTYPTTGGQVGGGAISHNLEVDSWVYGMFTDYPVCMQGFVIAAINGSTYSMSNYSSGGGEFVGQGQGELDVNMPPEGDPGQTPDVDTTATTNIKGGSNIEKTYNYVYQKLEAEGYSGDKHLATSALLGVLMLETSGINPATVNSIGAWGICQWLHPRKPQLFQMYGRTKRLDQQLDFMWWELNNTERRPKARWLSATNIPDAVDGFSTFERAEEWQNGRINRNHKNFKLRLKYAYEIYNSMKYTGGQTETPTPRMNAGML